VTPNGGGDRAFVHIKALEQMSCRPVTGLPIFDELVKDKLGRLNASGIRLAGRTPKNIVATERALPRKLISTLFLGAVLLGWLFAKVPTILALTYAAMSIFAVLIYGRDKYAARSNRWRTPENSLHLVALLGGWPGALYAQDVFRHKSKKPEFQFVFWVTVVLNCLVVAWLLISGNAAAINAAILDR